MNRAYKHVWSKALGRLFVVAECMRGGGGKAKSRRRKIASLLVAGTMLGMPALAGDLPSGGQVVSGSATIVVDGNAMTIDQSTTQMIANWQDFSIGAEHSVTFNQPGSSSVALNRVTGQDPSRILGNLNANGQVFLVNPNGIAIGRTGSVQTGGFVASTLGISNDDFLAGIYDFSGNGGAIINEGELSGGLVALIAPSVTNEGTITGDTALAGGTDVLLDFDGDGLLSVEVKASDVATLVENRGLVQADGGLAVLTARGASEAMEGVVNNSGTVEAKTIANRNGRILLLGDMEHGEVQVSGTLDASAPDGGDGGFVETSAARVEIAEDARVTTLAADGETGDWLIDPTDVTVGAGGAAQTVSGIGADTLSTNLASTNVTLQTVATGSEPGDIHINAAVNWDAPTTLTLDAHNDIHITAPITVANSGGGLALNYGGSGYHLGAPVSFTAGSGGSFSVNGDVFTLIHDVNQLQEMGNDLGSYWDPVFYALATDIDASATAGWNSGAGFMPIGDLGTSTDDRFSGTLEGLGHVITDLTINRPGRNHVGLIGYTYYADIRHVGLENARVIGNNTVGALVGRLQSDSTITQSYATGTVTGNDFAGGLVGYNSYSGSIFDSYASVAVTGTQYVGGLAGYQNNDGLIRQSYTTGSVTGGANDVGGLVGAGGGPIHQSFYATTDAGGNSITGGYTNSLGEGRTLAELQQLSTFADWGGDIDVQGGTGSAWRIYDGHTTPLLRAFLTPLAIDLGDVTQSVTYNGAEQSATGSHTVTESHDAALLLGDSTYAGSGTNAGEYAIGLDGLYSTQRGYDVVINPGTLTIDKVSLTVTANDDSKTYDAVAYGGGNGVSYAGFVGGEDEAVLTGSLAYGGSAQGAVNAGVYAVALSGLDSDNYDIAYADGILTIDKAAATVTANSDAVTYNGDAQSVLGFTATGLVGGEDGSVLDGVTTSGGSGTNAGTYTHTASGSDENYELTFVDGALTIEKAAATVTANSGTMTYNGDAQSVSGFTATGLVDGEDESVLDGVTTSGGGGTNAGTYTHTASGSDENYELTFVDGTLTIDKAAATVTANSGTVTYNGDAQSVSGFTVAGLVGGEDESVLDGVTTSGGSGTNAGTYAHTASGSDENYELAFVDGTLTIEKAAAAVTANSGTVTYNGSEQSVSGFTATGLVGGEDESVLDGVTTSGGSGTNAGTYTHTVDGVDQNYELTFVDGTLTIEKAAATVTANRGSVTYNGSEQSVSGFTATGLVGGEDESVLTGITTSGGSGTNAGTYAHTVDGVDQNYELTFVDGTLTIDKAAATVTANSGTVTYNGGEQSVSGFTATGLVGGEDESVLTGITTSGGSGTNAGTYTHTASGSDENYELAFVDGALTIDRASLTVTANNDSKIYDALAYSGGNGVSYTGFVGGEDEAVLTGSLAYGGSAQGADNAGDYAITLSGLDSDNYAIAYASGTLTIDRATISHIAGITAEDRIYDGTTAATLNTSGADFAGIVAGDVLTVSGGTGTFTDKNAGTGKTVNITGLGLGGADAGNYVLADGTAVTTADIAKATISAITGIEALDKIYDGTTAAALDLSGAGFTGMVVGDVLNLASATGNFADSNPGAGKTVTIIGLSLGGGDAANYTLAATTASALADINVMVDPPMPMHGRPFGADTCIGCLFLLSTSDALSANAGIINLDAEETEGAE